MKTRLSFFPVVILAVCVVPLYADDEPAPAAPRGPSLAKRFKVADANQDGKLTKLEFHALRADNKEIDRQRITARGETFDDALFDVLTFEIFMKLDTDNDGFVSKEEFMHYSAVNRVRPVKAEAQKKDPPKKEDPDKKTPPAKKPSPKKK